MGEGVQGKLWLSDIWGEEGPKLWFFECHTFWTAPNIFCINSLVVCNLWNPVFAVFRLWLPLCRIIFCWTQRLLSVPHSVITSVRMMFFGLLSKTTLRIFPIFCMSVEDDRVHYLSKMVFLKKFLILDHEWPNSLKITTKLMSDLAVDLNVIRIYLRLGLDVFVILMFCFMCYCIQNVWFYNNLSIAKWYSIFRHSGHAVYYEKIYIFVY